MTGARLLAIDTATSVAVVALGSAAGTLEAADGWPAGYRHGEDLLPRVRALLADRSTSLEDVAGVIVGTGPGAFTGLRVGIATAKGMAHGLGIPLAGVSTAEALLAASGVDRAVLLLPAGPSDRLVVRRGERPVPLPAGQEPDIRDGETLVALDLEDRAPADALERGEVAHAGLGRELIRLGAARLQAAGQDELETLVPDYVTLPRGVRAADGTVAWSRDHR